MARTTEELKQDIISSLDVISFYNKHLSNPLSPSRKSDGWTDRVKCPLHNDTGNPNFFVNVHTGGFKCFACGKSGSVFDFWIYINGYNPEDKSKFGDAIVALSNEVGIDISDWKNKPSRRVRPPENIKKNETPVYIPKKNKADSHDKENTPIPSNVIEKFKKNLRPDHYTFLLRKRGLKKKTIEKYGIGYDESWFSGRDPETGNYYNGRYTIPIRNASGQYRNIRGYSPISEPQYKMVNYVTNKGKPDEKKYGSPPRLFNLDQIVDRKAIEHVIFCEGEFDAILLNQQLESLGLETWIAVTGTHGVKTFEPEWMPYIFGKYIYFCFDCDEEGSLAAQNIVTKYFLPAIQAGKFSSVKIIDLPLSGEKNSKDITDFFLSADLTTEDFIGLCDSTPEIIAGGVETDDATVEAEEVENLVMAIKKREYIDKKVKVPLTISGATSKVYHAIREYRVSHCPMMSESNCCCENAGTQYIPYGHPLFIESCMQKQYKNIMSIARMTCQKDQKCKIDPVRKVVMEEYFAHQVVSRWRAEEIDGRLHNVQELVNSSVYILQPPETISIEPQDYIATGYVRTHPNTSMATLFVEHLEPLEEDWKKFTVENEDSRKQIEKIKEFSVEEIIDDITNGVTKIYESDDILYSVLLTYLSPLRFYFNGTILRGWLNVAIIGDSGTGKSATYMRLSDWLELGDIFSALSGTRTGLLYAIKQKAGEWHVSIGRYVQASCKIIAIDETQETSAEEIKRMAIAMDTGFLRIEQVASGGYHTQTRTIFMMNPKDAQGKAATILDFVYGCEALRQCFDPMFIRRLDLAVFTTGDHEYQFYNQPHKEEKVKQIKLTSKMLRSLIYWTWTRKTDQIIWDKEAEELCLEEATKMSGIYGHTTDIPLVNPQDFRENLARLSTAYAILDRNFTEDLQCVVVLPKHVQSMARFVDRVYSSPACNLAQKSKHARLKNTLDDFREIKNALEREGMEDHFLLMILLLEQLEAVRKRDLQDQLGARSRWVQQKIAILQGFNLIEIGRYGYKKTKKFNLFMQQWRMDEAIMEKLERVHVSFARKSLNEAKKFEESHYDEDESYVDSISTPVSSVKKNRSLDVDSIEDPFDL